MDLLLEVINIPGYHTLYMTLLISIIVKLFWVWKFDNSIITSIYTSDDIHFQSPIAALEKKWLMVRNPILSWISKFLRRIDGSTDDPEPFSLLK